MFCFRYIIAVCSVLWAGLVIAQTGTGNPFELEHRVKAALAELAATNGQSATSESVLPGNPFDVVSHRVPAAGQAQPRQERPGGRIMLRQQSSTHKSFVLVFLGGAIGFLALTFALGRSVAVKTWSAFFSNNFLIQAQRDYNGMIGSAPFYLLYVHFFVNMGLFAFLSIKSLTGDQFNSVGFLLLCIGAVSGFYLLKHLLVHLAGRLFDFPKEAAQYNFLILVFCCVLGLFLLPANLFLAFRQNTSYFLPFWVAATILVFYLFRWVRSLGLFGSFIAQNLLHFLLYLCAVEILPIALLIKLAMRSIA